MASKLATDPRIDPRLKAMFGGWPDLPNPGDAKDRDQLLAEVNTPEAAARAAQQKLMFDALDTVRLAKGLSIRTAVFTSAPDGNEIKIQYIRPEGDEVLPCVYYIHGGGMQSMSAYDGMYRAWGRIVARGVAVAMVDQYWCLHFVGCSR